MGDKNPESEQKVKISIYMPFKLKTRLYFEKALTNRCVSSIIVDFIEEALKRKDKPA